VDVDEQNRDDEPPEYGSKKLEAFDENPTGAAFPEPPAYNEEPPMDEEDEDPFA
jgi:hypothetical protein